MAPVYYIREEVMTMRNVKEMSSEEITAWFIESKQQGKPDEFIEGSIPLIKSLVHRKIRIPPFYTFDDVLQMGCIGLIKAYKNFDPNRNISWGTYASRCAYNEIICCFRSKSLDIREHVLSLQYQVAEGNHGEPLELHELVGGDEKGFDTIHNLDHIKSLRTHLFRKLSRREKQAYEIMTSNPDLSHREIAIMMGSSRSSVNGMIRRIREKATEVSQKYILQ